MSMDSHENHEQINVHKPWQSVKINPTNLHNKYIHLDLNQDYETRRVFRCNLECDLQVRFRGVIYRGDLYGWFTV